MESGRSRAWRAVAVAAFAATAFLPVHSCGPSPVAPHAVARTGVARSTPPTKPPRAPAAGPVRRPSSRPEEQSAVAELLRRLPQGFAEAGVLGAIWRARAWYPYLLVPVWAVALALAASASERRRRRAGALAVVVATAVVVLEWHYIRAEYSGLLPRSWRRVEVAVAWATVAAILFVRRPGRGFFDAEAAVSGQALLAGLHGFTFPIADVRTWSAAGATPDGIASAVLANYPWPFWLAVAATFAAAIPGYRPAVANAPARASPPEPAEARDGLDVATAVADAGSPPRG